MKKIAILIQEKCAMFELGCALELFSLSRPDIPNWYTSQVVSFENKKIDCGSGLTLQAECIKDLKDFEMLIVPSWSVDNDHICVKQAEEIVKFANQGKRIISFCSGAFLLARLGILNGKKATTHWQYAARFQQSFKNVQYQDNVLYVYDGQLGCSAGSAAAIDLGLEVIRQDFGFEVANKVAKRMVISAQRQGGQAQYSHIQRPNQSMLFQSTLDWAKTQLKHPISIEEMAKKAGMSRRSFDRKFRTDMGSSAKSWLTFERLSSARILLESSQLSIEQISEEVGFSNSTLLRHHFKQALGVSPTQYQKQFQAG